MPQTIDGLTYPKTVAELLASRNLTRLMLQTYTSPEVRNRIKFMIQPPKAANVFVDYINSNAPNHIDLPNHIKAMATDLIKNNDHDVRLWQGVADLVEANCRTYLEGEIFPDFFDVKTCKAFSAHHRNTLLAAAEKKFGKAGNVMLRLNLTEEPAVAGILVEMYRGNLKGAMELAKYAVRKAKLNVDPAEVLRAIKSGGGLTETGAFKVDIKKLKLCGFADAGDKTLKNRIEDMVNAWMSGDKTTAKKIFQLVQKDEPKDSLAKTGTIEGMFKAFSKFKVVIG